MNIPLRFDWTDARVTDLRLLFGEGHADTAIARIMGPGLSRNAVIGKRGRLGLLRLCVPKRAKASPPKRKNRNRVMQESFGRKVAPSPVRRMQPDLEAEEARNLPPDQSPHAVPLFEITDNQCRWPLNDPGPGFLFCGAGTVRECSWCPRHARLAFTPGRQPERYAMGRR